MSTFEDLGARRRFWFLQLAATAARELLIRLGWEREFPDNAPELMNPFEGTAAKVVDITERLSHDDRQRRRRTV